MIIPKGTAWQHLRALCFDALPAGATSHYTRAVPLDTWRHQGSFHVLTCTKKFIVIESSGVEAGSALLADSEYLLDHAAEQHATVRNFLTRLDWHSPAWAAVTAYYWSFFSAMALTRMVGNTIWFLDRAALTEFRKLAGETYQPGAGALNVMVGNYLSATNREVVLRPSKAQLHEALWIRFHELAEELLSHSDAKANSLEYRMLWCLVEARRRLGTAWPSKVRNLVNYRPGRAYREVTRGTEIDAAPYVRRKSPFTSEKLISSFEDEVVKVKLGAQPAECLPLACRLSVLLAITVAEIARDLHFELMERTSADRRWCDLRRSFLQRHCPGDNPGMAWPIGAEI